MTTVIPTTADSRFHATRGLAGAPHKWLSKKCKSLSKKCDSNRPSPSNLTSQTRDQWAVGAYRVRHPSAREAAMKRCAQCHGKLGLGVRSRNVWNGRWWTHTRFCSAHCEGKYELERYNANVKQHRWYTYLYPSSPQS